MNELGINRELVMVSRFCYISSWNNVQQPELLGGLQFSLNQAVEKDKMLTLVVNSIRNCDQIIEKMFNGTDCSKLKRGQSLSINGVSIRLRSPDSVKSHEDYGIIFTIHTSPQALTKIESNKHLDTVVLFSEEAEHIHLWKTQKSVTELQPEKDA